MLDADLPKGEGTQEGVGLDYKTLPQDVVPGDILLLDDGRVQLKSYLQKVIKFLLKSLLVVHYRTIKVLTS